MISTPADRRMVSRRPVKVATGRPCTGSFPSGFLPCAASRDERQPAPLDPSSNVVEGWPTAFPFPQPRGLI